MKLDHLNLRNNEIAGELPLDVVKLKDTLVELYLDENQLTALPAPSLLAVSALITYGKFVKYLLHVLEHRLWVLPTVAVRPCLFNPPTASFRCCVFETQIGVS